MQKQRFFVTFDDGNEVETQLKSRDLANLEADGFSFDDALPMRGTYTMVHAVLRRLRAAGMLDFEPPSTVDDLLKCADIEVIEDADAEGEGSGQAAVTG